VIPNGNGAGNPAARLPACGGVFLGAAATGVAHHSIRSLVDAGSHEIALAYASPEKGRKGKNVGMGAAL
jgi:hypothetical protein